MKPPNEPVADCDCPIKNCDKTAPVYKYRAAGDPSRRRFAGKLYCICPKHGRIETQEFLLENLKWREGKSGDDSEPAIRLAPTPEQATPAAPTPTATTASPKKPQAPSAPTQSAPKPSDETPPAKKPWTLFG